MEIYTESPAALDAYEALAPDYDVFTAGYDYAAWFGAIHARARELGIPGRRALDFACGTGKSTEVLIAAGYETRGVDLSPSMIAFARRRMPAHADAFSVADLRALPDLGPVDLALCLDDSLNYLLSGEELAAAVSGMARSLAPGGVLVFDVNTLLTFRTSFAQTLVQQTPDRFFAWRGLGDPQLAVGGTAAAELETFAALPAGGWERRSSRHVERHHPAELLRDAIARAGLRCRAVAGQLRGGRLVAEADELRHIKHVYFAQRP